MVAQMDFAAAGSKKRAAKSSPGLRPQSFGTSGRTNLLFPEPLPQQLEASCTPLVEDSGSRSRTWLGVKKHWKAFWE